MDKRLYFLLIIIFAVQSVSSQSTKGRPSFVAMNVSNIDTSINWYTHVFDLKLRNRVDNSVRGFKQAILVNKEIMFELVELNRSLPADSLLKSHQQGTKLLGFTKVGFVVPNIESTLQHFSNLGLTFHGKMVSDPVDKKRTFLIKDPDGNLLQFFEE